MLFEARLKVNPLGAGLLSLIVMVTLVPPVTVVADCEIPFTVGALTVRAALAVESSWVPVTVPVESLEIGTEVTANVVLVSPSGIVTLLTDTPFTSVVTATR